MRLTLFFTRNLSLQAWANQGMLDREVAIYQALQQQGVEVGFVTYGDRRDRAFASRLPGIKILCNYLNLPAHRYQRWLHLLHAPWLLRSDVYKTNQTSGAEVALRVAQFWRKPLVARCGYMWSDFVAAKHGEQSSAAQNALNLEQTVFTQAQRVVVTTPLMANDITNRIPEVAPHTAVIPNYVETERFRPLPDIKKEFDLVFVGRLESQKNVDALLSAIAPLDVSLLLIGSGSLEKDLKEKYSQLRDQVQWQGNVPNAELPQYLNRARGFILPSHYEGHPKALIEAMSCGLPVIGTKVVGTREILTDRENGLLCETSPESISQSIQTLLSQPEHSLKLGENAREYVLRHFSLSKIVQQELETLTQAQNRQ